MGAQLPFFNIRNHTQEMITMTTTPQKKNAPQDLPFEKAVTRLEEIAANMDSGRLGLDEMIRAFEEGQNLVKHCYSKLNDVEKKIELLVKNEDGTTSTTPFIPVPE